MESLLISNESAVFFRTALWYVSERLATISAVPRARFESISDETLRMGLSPGDTKIRNYCALVSQSKQGNKGRV